MGFIYHCFKKIYHLVWKKIEKSDNKRLKTLKLPENIEREDYSYNDESDPLRTFSIYYPKGVDISKLPIIVDVHGGGWVYGTKELNRPFCMELASRGFVVMGMSYRLVTDNFKIPDQFIDILQSLEVFKKIAKEKKLDLNNVFITGDSAGGYYALCLACLNGQSLLHRNTGYESPLNFIGVSLNHPSIDLEKLVLQRKWYKYVYKMIFGDQYADDIFFKSTKNLECMCQANKIPPLQIINSKGDDLLGKVNDQAIEKLRKIQPNLDVIYNEDENPSTHIYNVTYINSSVAIKTNDKIADFFKSLKRED